ncbi:hypothetical protein Tco_0718053 [Tanacetum coccineum]
MEQPDFTNDRPKSPIQIPPVTQDEEEREPMEIYRSTRTMSPNPEDGPVNYPMDEGDDGDDDDGDSSRDDVDDEDDVDEEDEDDEDEEEEDKHLAPADSVVVASTIELVSPPKGTDPIIPPPSTDIATTGARIIVRLQASISLPPEAEVERLLAMPTPPPSPLISLSSPSAGERLARIASTQALIDAVTAALPSPLLLPLPPSLYIPPPVDHRDDIPESELPPRKSSCLSTLGSRYEVRESSTTRPIRGRGIDYRFVSTVDAEARQQGIREVGYELAEIHEHVTQDLYALLEDAQDSRTQLSQQVDLLMEDRRTLQETVLIVEEEAYASREAYAHSIGLSQTVHHELQTHREQAELLALREQQRRARQPGPDARVPDYQKDSRDADSRI